MNVRHDFLLIGVVLLVVCAFVGTASATEIWVPSPGNETIQQAVNNASSYDTIIVRDATYNENVDVNMAHITIRSENGSANCIVQALSASDHVFEVTADYVNISGFTVQGAPAGISLNTVDHCTLSENTASNNIFGILLESSSNNTLSSNTASNNHLGIYLYFSSTNNLTNNTANSNSNYGIWLDRSSTNNLMDNIASDNDKYGIYLWDSSTNNLTGNIASDNDKYGIYLYSSSTNNLTNNIANSNIEYGIYLYFSGTNNLMDNIASDNDKYGIYLFSSSTNNLTNNTANSNIEYGIYLYFSYYNNLMGNTALDNDKYGIYLFSSSTNNLTNNTANSNQYGIYLDYSSNSNTITNNTANSNTWDGIYLASSSNNLSSNIANSNNNYGICLSASSNNNTLSGNIANSNSDYGIYLISSSNNNTLYNNYFNNTNNAYDDGNNIWNISKTPGTNIIGGSYLGGNYWSDYTGKDTNGDGLGDTLIPYNSSGNIQSGGDWLPLVMAEEDPYTNVDVGVTSNITVADPEDLTAYLPPEYDGMDISDAVVLTVDVADNTTDPTDDAYTDITINVGEMDIATCKVFKAGMAFLPEVPDVKTLPTVDGEPAFSRDVVNNTVTIRLYVGDPLLGVLPPAEPLMFDTGEGTYPSISGVFTGTIMPSRDLTVSTLYTYSCAGTGGHTKSIELYENTTLLANGVWEGYQSDWHNITIMPSVSLLKDHEYRYFIETGSYPQIVHAESKDVTGGTITCTEFTDANGIIHYEWIPAIRLE
jgi:parallel beta-helix repeat protein